MNWQEKIPELQSLLVDYKTKRANAKSAYNKYKHVRAKFDFLDSIIKPKTTKTKSKEDDDLVIAIKDLLKSIGIKSKLPTNNANFDIISTFKTCEFGIEVKNSNLPSENEMFQAHKYKVRNNFAGHPIIIWNDSGRNQSFDQNRSNDALKNGYGILTTNELRKGYLKLKLSKITFDQFLQQLQKSGLIKFSTRALSK